MQGLNDLAAGANGNAGKIVRHRLRERGKHLWGPGRPVPEAMGSDAEFKKHSCRRCGAAGKSFPGNPHIIADKPGGCW